MASMDSGAPNAGNSTNNTMRIGWAMHAAAVVVVLGVLVWGVYLYPDLPEQIPIHWNAAGEADDYRPKSIGWAFGPLFIALGMIVGIAILNRVMGRNDLTVPSEREAYRLTLGYVNLSMALIFGWISLAGWYDLELGPWMIAAALLGSLPVLLIMGLYYNRISAERKALASDPEPSLNPENWVWGGMFYSNPNDPRTMVPKPPHTGIGMTFNLAAPGGKLMLVVLILVVLVTLLLAILL